MWRLIVGITGLSVLGWFVNSQSPDSVGMIALFFLIIAVTLYFFSVFVLHRARSAALVTFGIVIWLFLRLIGLREWYYPLLLIPILISLEVLLRNG